jgi:aryl carrier-like protein
MKKCTNLSATDFNKDMNIVPPSTDDEVTLCRLLKEILCRDDFGVTTDLFEMGLSSLGVVRLITDAEKEGMKLDFVDIVEYRTIRGIAESLTQGQSEENREDYALSEARERAVVRPAPIGWLESENPGDIHFPELYSFGMTIDAQKLCDALNQVVENRSALSMIIERDDAGRAFMRYDAARTPHYEVQRLTEAEFEAKRASLIRTFVMYGAPLIHAGVYETERSVYLFVDIHHIIMDGTSMMMFFDDIEKAYHGEPLGQDTYCTYLAQMEQERSTERYRKAKDEWLQILGDEGYRVGFTPDRSGDKSDMLYQQCRRVMTRAELCCLLDRLGVSEGLLFIGLTLLTMARIEGEGRYLCSAPFHNRRDAVSRNAFGWICTVITVTAKIMKGYNVAKFFTELKETWIDSAATISSIMDAMNASPRSIHIIQALFQTYEANSREVMISMGAKRENVQKSGAGGMLDHAVLYYEKPDVIVPMLEINTTHYSPEKQSDILNSLETVIDRIVAVEDPGTATLAELLG